MRSSRLDVVARMFVHDDSREPSPEISLSAWLGPEPAYEVTARVWFRGAERRRRTIRIEASSLSIACRDLREWRGSQSRIAPWWPAMDLMDAALFIESGVRTRTRP